MFGTAHIIFIIISFLLIAAGVLLIRKVRPPIERVVRICFVLALLCEVVKLFCVIQVVPVVEPAIENGALVYHETGAFTPYLQAEHMPLELCSLQIVFMFLAIVFKDPKKRRVMYAIIYGTAIIGGLLAILFCYISSEFDSTRAFLTAPRVWEFFFYHTLIIVLAVAIGMDEKCGLRFRDLNWMVIVVVGLDLVSLYVNSLLSVPYYEGGKLAGIGYAVNLFSSYNDPLGIVQTSKAQYLLYLLCRLGIAAAVVPLVYLPFLGRGRKGRAQNSVSS